MLVWVVYLLVTDSFFDQTVSLTLGCSWLKFCLMSSAASICFYKILPHRVCSKFSLEHSPVNLCNCCINWLNITAA